MQIPIISGISADETADWRTALPRNLVVVPTDTGISKAYLRTAPGITQFATGVGLDRGGINWDGSMYRVMGTSLVRIDSAGVVATLGDVGEGGYCTLDYGFDRLAVWSGGRLYYYTDAGVFLQVTDSDLGVVIDGCWMSGYFISTDGVNIVVTELNDPTSVDPLKYGSAEFDPDALLAVRKLAGQLIAFGRYTVETYAQIGGSGFPFQVNQGSQITTGIVGTHAVAPFGGSYAFVGSARNAPPSVYLLGSGTAPSIATREVEKILAGYTDAQLAAVVVESQHDSAHQFLYIHLPDKTLVFDGAASQALGQPQWTVRTSGLAEAGQYRARGLVYCYGKWLSGDPTAVTIGEFSESLTGHYGTAVGWQFSTPIAYTDSTSGIVHALELVTLPGRVPLGADPPVFTSYSHDGETWSQEFIASAGKQGERGKRIAWRRQGMIRNTRIQRFRGESRIAVAALEASFEPLSAGG